MAVRGDRPHVVSPLRVETLDIKPAGKICSCQGLLLCANATSISLLHCFLPNTFGFSPPSQAQSLAQPAASNESNLLGPATTGAKRFPDRLYELLNSEAAQESLYWLPGGKAFAIEQAGFASKVLDKYFQATKLPSFIRRLHKW